MSTPEPITLDSIEQEIDNLLATATRLAGIVSAAALLHENNLCKKATATLIFLSDELAAKLNHDLDMLSVRAGQLRKAERASAAVKS